MKRTAALKILLTGLLLSGSASSFAIYKCDAGGKTTYSDTECPGGKTLDVNIAVPAGATDAARQAREEKYALDRLERARNKREAKEERERQRAAKTAAAQQKKCSALARKQKWAEEDAATVTGRSAETARRKARRKAEEYEAECGRANGLGIAG